jgi:subtilase family serine protease
VSFEDGFATASQGQHGSQQLSGYVTAATLAAPLLGPLPSSDIISPAVRLPGQNPDAMKQAAHDVADPASPSFRQYMSADDFAAAYGAVQSDYQAVVDWATAHGLSVTATYPNRLLVDVSGTASQIQQALYIGLEQRLRPDGSRFFTLDREPSIDLAVKVLRISGLDDRVLATPGAGAGPGEATIPVTCARHMDGAQARTERVRASASSSSMGSHPAISLPMNVRSAARHAIRPEPDFNGSDDQDGSGRYYNGAFAHDTGWLL